jgi:hypothetical protein
VDAGARIGVPRVPFTKSAGAEARSGEKTLAQARSACYRRGLRKARERTKGPPRKPLTPPRQCDPVRDLPFTLHREAAYRPHEFPSSSIASSVFEVSLRTRSWWASNALRSDGFARVNAAIWTARGSLSQVKSASRSLSANVRRVIATSTARRSCPGPFNERSVRGSFPNAGPCDGAVAERLSRYGARSTTEPLVVAQFESGGESNKASSAASGAWKMVSHPSKSARQIG